jgi:hypothetical protein
MVDHFKGGGSLADFADATVRGERIGAHVFSIGISAEEAIEWICHHAGTLAPDLPVTGLAVGILNAGIQANGHKFARELLAAADNAGHNLEWKVRLLTYAPEKRETWDIVQALGPDATAAYWRQFFANFLPPLEPRDKQFALERLLEVARPVTALRGCCGSFSDIDPDIVLRMLEAIQDGQEAVVAKPDSSDFQYAIDYLEQSDDIDRRRLARVEFALIPSLALDREHHAVSLFALLMSEPDLFVELLCLHYKPKDGEALQATESEREAADSAWRVFQACKRQPGSDGSGNFTEESVNAYVTKVRELAATHHRLEACDHKLGEIMGRADRGQNGVFPSQPIRDAIEDIGTEEMLKGFAAGCFDRQRAFSRGAFEGGDQERDLAGRYRAKAEALQITHPKIADVLFRLASTYDREGRTEDTDLLLRRERH